MKSGSIRLDTVLHMNMSLVGGFMGTYAISLRDGVFPSAQTGNLMGIAASLINGNREEMLVRIGFFLVFVFGLSFSYVLRQKYRYDPRRLCLVQDAAALILTGCIPAESEPIAAIYPLAYAASFQWGVFSGSEGYASASIFSTNNVRQCVFGLTEYLLSKDTGAGKQALYYAATLLTFLTGACIGCAGVAQWGSLAAVLGLPMLVPAHILLSVSRKEVIKQQDNTEGS